MPSLLNEHDNNNNNNNSSSQHSTSHDLANNNDLYKRAVTILKASVNKDRQQELFEADFLQQLSKILSSHPIIKRDLAELCSRFGYYYLEYGLLQSSWLLGENSATKTDYLIRIAELLTDVKEFKRSDQIYILTINASVNTDNNIIDTITEALDPTKVQTPQACLAKYGMIMNFVMQDFLDKAIQMLTADTMSEQKPPAKLEAAVYFARNQGNIEKLATGEEAGKLLANPEYTLSLARILLDKHRVDDAVLALTRSLDLISSHVSHHASILDLKHQLAMAKGLKQFAERAAKIANNDLRSLLSS